MKFPLIESLNKIRIETDSTAQYIMESVQRHPKCDLIIESADTVLGALAAKLRAGKKLSPEELEEYAQLYASLSLLAREDIRQGFNIDTSTPTGKAKFSRVVNNVGVDLPATNNVKRVAMVNGQSYLQQIRTDLTNFSGMDEMKQQQFINQVNKLRIGYERVKNQLKSNAAPTVSAAI